ncbi:MAG: histidine kinase [Pseudomonadota bacterium]
MKRQLVRILENVEEDRGIQFWSFQAVGWLAFCFITFLSLTVWYETPQLSHIAHIFLQAALGAMLCLPLRAVFRRIWQADLVMQVLAVSVAAVCISFLWTALRMQTFLWLAEEYDIWEDFGGWYFGSLMVFLCWTSLYFGIKFYLLLVKERRDARVSAQQIQEAQLARLSAEAGARDAQLKMLRYQLNPHFLFNALNSVAALIKTQRSDEARAMIGKLSQFLRASLDTETEPMTRLSDEIDALKLYLSIEKVRFGERLQVEYCIADEVLNASIPSLVTQPSVENALKYAVAGREAGGHIKISARKEGRILVLSIEDDGPGLSNGAGSAAGLPGIGVGLRNTRERLEKHFGGDASMAFESGRLGGFAVIISIPFQGMDRAIPRRLPSRPEKVQPL